MANAALFDYEVGLAARAKRGVLRRILDRMIEARTREARRRVAQAISLLGEQRLVEAGLTREELAIWNSRAGL